MSIAKSKLSVYRDMYKPVLMNAQLLAENVEIYIRFIE